MAGRSQSRFFGVLMAAMLTLVTSEAQLPIERDRDYPTLNRQA